MGNVGIRVSREGFDVLTCADYQLLSSSSFPSPMIVFRGQVSIPDLTKDVTLVTHNLGFYPLFNVFINGTWDDGGTGSQLANLGWGQYIATSTVDLKYLGASRAGGSKVGSATLIYFVYSFNPMLGTGPTTFKAPIINSTAQTQGPISSNIGWKVANKGRDVSDPAPIHSTSSSASYNGQSIRQLLIHQAGFGTNINSASITHNLPYPPMSWVFAYVHTWADSRYQMMLRSDGSTLNSGNTVLSFAAPQVFDYYYVIFKDPSTT